MIALTDEMREALDRALPESTPCMIATASGDGRPDIAFKGSMIVFDPEHLAYWERSKGQTLRNVEENPNVCVLYRSRERGTWKFVGEATIHREGELRERVKARTPEAELNRDPGHAGYAVLVKVNLVISRGQVLQQR